MIVEYMNNIVVIKKVQSPLCYLQSKSQPLPSSSLSYIPENEGYRCIELLSERIES